MAFLSYNKSSPTAGLELVSSLCAIAASGYLLEVVTELTGCDDVAVCILNGECKALEIFISYIAGDRLGDDFEKVPGSGDGTKGTYKLKESELIEVADASKTYTVEETLHTLAGFDVKVTNTIGGTDK